MDIKQFTLLEVYGLAETINEYTRDYYVKTYSRKMIEFSENEQYDNLLLVIIRLIEWYDEAIKGMTENKYLYNLKEHKKSYEILKLVKKELEERKYE